MNSTNETVVTQDGLFDSLYKNYISKKYFGLEIYYYSIVVFVPLVLIALLLRFFVLSKRRHAQLSPQLKVHLIFWFISMLLGFAFYSTIYAKKTVPNYLNITSPLSEIIRGSLHIASTNTIPLSTFFLLVDRVLAISVVGARLHTWRKKIKTISIVVLISDYFLNLSILFWRTLINPDDPSEICTFSCRTNQTTRDLLTLKLVTSILNIICGSVFVYLYLVYSKTMRFKRERKLNHTILVVFVTELICTILPTSVYLIFNNVDFFRTIQLSSMISVGHAIDGVCTAILYWSTRTSQSATTKLFQNASNMPNNLSNSGKSKTLSTHSLQLTPIRPS